MVSKVLHSPFEGDTGADGRREPATPLPAPLPPAEARIDALDGRPLPLTAADSADGPPQIPLEASNLRGAATPNTASVSVPGQPVTGGARAAAPDPTMSRIPLGTEAVHAEGRPAQSSKFGRNGDIESSAAAAEKPQPGSSPKPRSRAAAMERSSAERDSAQHKASAAAHVAVPRAVAWEVPVCGPIQPALRAELTLRRRTTAADDKEAGATTDVTLSRTVRTAAAPPPMTSVPSDRTDGSPVRSPARTMLSSRNEVDRCVSAA